MPCTGNSADHCCYQNGKPCIYVEENTVPGRRWACGLMRELGDWDAVLASDRYKENVVFTSPDMNCRDYPQPGTHCSDCGVQF